VSSPRALLSDIVTYTDLSETTIRKYLKNLLEEGVVEFIWSRHKVKKRRFSVTDIGFKEFLDTISKPESPEEETPTILTTENFLEFLKEHLSIEIDKDHPYGCSSQECRVEVSLLWKGEAFSDYHLYLQEGKEQRDYY